MPFLAGLVIGTLLIYCAREETRASDRAPTAAQAVRHDRMAEVFMIAGWIILTLCVAIPIAFVGMFLLFPIAFF